MMDELRKEIHALAMDEAMAFYAEVKDRETMRWLCRNDRFYLLVCVLGASHAANGWCYARCREVEAEPEGWLDLWSRGHYKSTVITFAGAVQEILRDPEVTIGILAYNKGLAAKFVNQIMGALESPALAALFPDILWPKPPPTNWSAQNGLWVRRKGVGKEPTVMGTGLVDGQPTGMHFQLMIYDDVVVRESVTTPEQIRKTTEAWELSRALGMSDGTGRTWYAGTRYHQADTYGEILARGVVEERRRLCVDDAGRPTLMTRVALEQKRTEMGPAMWSAQMMQDPVAAGTRTFRDEWWCVYLAPPPRVSMRVAIVIDSANAKRRTSDYTTMWVVGLAADQNYYLLDGSHDRLDLIQRTDALFALVQRWRPECVFWEQVGAMSDTAHVRYVQGLRAYHFRIAELNQTVNKNDRIGWLQPTFAAGRLWVPQSMLRPQADGESRDLMLDLREDEYRWHPVCRHDDMLDCLANIHHPAFTAVMAFPRPPDEGRRDRCVTEWNPYA